MPKRMMFKLSTGEEFLFALNPREYTAITPARVNIVQTKGGVFADNFGVGVTAINIKGIAKNNFVRDKDGNVRNTALDTFKELRDKVVLNYFDGQIPGLPPTKTMEFYNFTDEDYYEVIPMQFSLTRSATKALFYNYEINLVVVRKLSDPEAKKSDIVENYLQLSEENKNLYPLSPTPSSPIVDAIINPDEASPSTTPLPFIFTYGDEVLLFNIQEIGTFDIGNYIREHTASFIPNLAYISPDLANSKPTEIGAILQNQSTGAVFMVNGVDPTLPPNTIRIEVPTIQNTVDQYLASLDSSNIDYGILPILQQAYNEENENPNPEVANKLKNSTINLLYPFEKLRTDYWLKLQSSDENTPDPLEQQLVNQEIERMEIVKDINEVQQQTKQAEEILKALNTVLIPEEEIGTSLSSYASSELFRTIRMAQLQGELGVNFGKYGTIIFSSHLTDALPILQNLPSDIAQEKKILIGTLERKVYPTIDKPPSLDINTTEAEALAAYGHVLGLERVVTDVLSMPPEAREEAEELAKDMLYENDLILDKDKSLEEIYQDLISQGIFTGGTASAGLINHLHQMQFPGAVR